MKKLIVGIFAVMVVGAVLCGCHTPTPVPPPMNAQLRGLELANNWSTSPDSIVDDLATAGCTAIGFELMEYITSGNLATVQNSQADKLASKLDECDKKGVRAIVIRNSNDYLNGAPGVTTQTIIDGLTYLKNKFGTKRFLLQPWSETASSHVDGDAVRRAAQSMGFACIQYVGHGVTGQVGTEAHPCKIADGLCGLPGQGSSHIVDDCTSTMLSAVLSGGRETAESWLARRAADPMAIENLDAPMIHNQFVSVLGQGATMLAYTADAANAAKNMKVILAGIK